MNVTDLERKAKKARHREGPRRAALVWRRICEALPESATHFALLASTLLAAGRRDEAVDALRTAVWLRMREGSDRKAASLARLLLTLVESDATAQRALARAA